jgi:hypothetical protein
MAGTVLRTAIAPAILVAALAAGAGPAAGQSTFSIKFTSQALGLGTADINAGKMVDADRPGLITSPTTGLGSVLTIGADGRATTGAAFVTVTAASHLDVVSYPPAPFPTVHDFQAAVIYITKENTSLPDGKDEGLGVRAFTVKEGTTATSGLRKLDGSTGRALIEGSKEVSGGTDQPVYKPSSPNGAPHVDEAVRFAFAAGSGVDAASVELTVSKFVAGDIVVLTLGLAGGTEYTYGIGTTHPGMTAVGSTSSNLWRFRFASLALPAGSVLERLTIKAIDPNPASPKGTAEHFDVTAMTGSYCGDACNQPDRTLNVNVIGPCGLIESAEDLSCRSGPVGVCTITVAHGTVVALGASGVNVGDELDHWEDAADPTLCSGGPWSLPTSCGVTMDADREVFAYFTCQGT